MKKIFGINTVREALTAGLNIDRILILKNKREKLKDISDLAKTKKSTIKYVSKDLLNREAGEVNHQGVVAFINKFSYPKLSENELCYEGDNKKIYLLLDGITDPHNLGAMIRSADVFGVSAIILPKDNSAKINETVFKTSSGAVSYVPVCTITNISRTLDKLKESGFWIYGADIDNGTAPRNEKFPNKVVIVIGSEGKGMKRLTKEKCDVILTVPSCGNVDSLNASNACAVLLYEVYTQHLTT